MVKEILVFMRGLCKTVFMISTILRRGFFTLSMVLFLLLSFSLRPSFVKASQNSPPPAAKSPKSEKKDASSKDKSTGKLTRYFAQADGIHREAWWVITNEKWPVGKSPFGKVERALMASENIKLSNKSLFRCDRYLVKRGVLPAKGFPQKLEIFEKCSDKTEAKKIADVNFANEFDVQVTFFPENLAEILGLGPTILNKPIECRMQASDSGVLNSLNCKNWSQDRTKEQMVRLDSYNYQKDKKSLIKLRGKIYQNLTDIRKIEVDVPLEGKITVTETELYPPEEDDKKADAKKADKGKSAQKKSPTEKNMEPG
ncbi:MAG TPA: hypothetical protein VN132_10035, partial [Bdellovibrio sp.]|nr:hypothetical protein [Bdellovibrio sp.]